MYSNLTFLKEEAKSSLRGRVIEFENEMQDKLIKLQPSLEKEILQVGLLRNNWVESICLMDSSESEIYNRRLEILKSQCELIHYRLSIDIKRLEAQYETQSLNYLIESTRPIDESQSLEDRSSSLSSITMKNITGLLAAIKNCSEYRQSLISTIFTLQVELQKIKIECESHYNAAVDMKRERIAKFADYLRSKCSIAYKNHRKVMSDYLILRHNSKVAKEMLLRSQSDAMNARKELEIRLDQLKYDAEREREKMTATTGAEIKAMVGNIRSQVVEKEMEYEEVKIRVRLARRVSSLEVKRLKKEIRKCKVSYNELEEIRVSDYFKINDELRRLRGMIAEAEAAL